MVAYADNSLTISRATTETTTIVTIKDEAKVENVKRFGINLGARDQYGAGQYLKNLVPNPGFESAEYNMIFNLASHQNGTTFVADFWDTNWNDDAVNIGQPEGFWNGADFYFLTGEAAVANRHGTITNFTHADDKYTFETADAGVWPTALDALAVRKTLDGYEGDISPYRLADATTTRPNSSGTQSLMLTSTDDWSASFVDYFDSYGRDADTAAGKLYLVDGQWHFEIWAKAQTAGDRLRVSFRRIDETSFMNESFELTTEWQKLQHTFSVTDGRDTLNATRNADGTSNPLVFELILAPASDAIWVDDVVLQKVQQNPTAFSDDFVALLQELQPGILRNWGDQLGSSLDNQLADPFARKLTGISPKYRAGYNYHYSLHEFLELCQLVGAEPSYVIPTGFTSAEMQNLAAYLAAPAGSHPYADVRAELGQTDAWTDVFDTIHLEYGNEIWGGNQGEDPFLGATVRGGKRAATLANLRFAELKSSDYFDTSKFNLNIGGQTIYPERQHQLEMFGTEHNTISLAPYFGSLDSYETAEEMFLPLYAHAQETVTAGSQVQTSKEYIDSFGRGTELAIYELNLHAVTGDVPIETRNSFLSGLGGGLALPLTMLSYQSEMGIRNISAYNALQFSQQIGNGDYARLFGLLRDVAATGSKRPTWLGLEMANKAIQGDMLVTTQTGLNPNFRQTESDIPYIQSYAYRDGDDYALILFNLHLTDEQTVQVDMPSAPNESAVQHLLSADSLYSNNESAENVTIATTSIDNLTQGEFFSLPPHSMLVLEWTTGTTEVPTAVQLASTNVQPTFALLPTFWLTIMLTLGVLTRRLWRI